MAFRSHLEITFRISEKENEEFCEENERMVEELITQRREDMELKYRMDYVDIPEMKRELIVDILNGFKEKSLGPSGITRNLLLNTHKNNQNVCGSIFGLPRDGVLPRKF